MKKHIKIIESALAVFSVFLFSMSWLMSYWLWQEMPMRENVESGYTIEEVIHGRTVYLNSIYDIIYITLFWGGPLLFFCAVLIDFYKDPFDRRGR